MFQKNPRPADLPKIQDGDRFWPFSARNVKCGLKRGGNMLNMCLYGRRFKKKESSQKIILTLPDLIWLKFGFLISELPVERIVFYVKFRGGNI